MNTTRKDGYDTIKQRLREGASALVFSLSLAMVLIGGYAPPARAQPPAAAKPNIVVIWGDDIGMTNLSCYTTG